MSCILVTGASGFIGRAVIAAFQKDGHMLRAAVRRLPKTPFPDGVEVMQHTDFLETIDWQPLLDGIDIIVHLAGVAHTRPGVAPELYDRVNRLTTAQAATAAAAAGVSRFVYVSSIRAQCGPSADHVLTERDPAAPTDAYGRSKLAAEESVRSSGVAFTILRPVLLYGQSVKGNFATLLRAANSPWPLPLKQFTNRRSLLGIDNFISALRFALSTPATLDETYVVADPGIPLTLSGLIATLREAQDRRPRLVPVPTMLVELLLRMTGRRDLWDRVGGSLWVDPSKFIAAGWRPVYDTRAGVAAIVQKRRHKEPKQQ